MEPGTTESTHSSPSTASGGKAAGSGQPHPPSPLAPFWLYGVPIVCVILVLLFWNETRKDIATLSEQQRQLAADFDAARGVTTIDVAGAPALGPADQVVTLVEFSDYECPFCIRHFTTTMPEIDRQLIRTGRIRYVFRDFPIADLHPAAQRAHEAGHCANEQGKFWDLHARLFSPAGTHTDAQLEARAVEAGLTLPAFKECLASGRTVPDVQNAIRTAAELGANGTPSFFVGLRDPATDQVRLVSAVIGAQPFSEFDKAVTAAAARVK